MCKLYHESLISNHWWQKLARYYTRGHDRILGWSATATLKLSWFNSGVQWRSCPGDKLAKTLSLHLSTLPPASLSHRKWRGDKCLLSKITPWTCLPVHQWKSGVTKGPMWKFTEWHLIWDFSVALAGTASFKKWIFFLWIFLILNKMNIFLEWIFWILKKMNILFEWIFWILKKWIFCLNEYSGF